MEFTLRYIPVPGVEEPAMEEPLVQIQVQIMLFGSEGGGGGKGKKKKKIFF